MKLEYRLESYPRMEYTNRHLSLTGNRWSAVLSVKPVWGWHFFSTCATWAKDEDGPARLGYTMSAGWFSWSYVTRRPHPGFSLGPFSGGFTRGPMPVPVQSPGNLQASTEGAQGGEDVGLASTDSKVSPDSTKEGEKAK